MKLYQKGTYRFDEGPSPAMVVRFDLEDKAMSVTLVVLDHTSGKQHGDALMTVKADDPRLVLNGQTATWLVYQEIKGVKYPEFVTQKEELADEFIASHSEGEIQFKKMCLAMVNKWDD